MKLRKLEAGINGEVLLKSKGLTRILESSIEIETTAEEAWQLLVNFEKWKF